MCSRPGASGPRAQSAAAPSTAAISCPRSARRRPRARCSTSSARSARSLALDRPEVALGRTAERALWRPLGPPDRTSRHRSARTANGSSRADDPPHRRGRQRDEVRIAAHEAHEAAVLHHLDDVAAQAARPGRRRRPPNAAPGHPRNGRRSRTQRQPRPELQLFALPRTGSPGPAASPTRRSSACSQIGAPPNARLHSTIEA